MQAFSSLSSAEESVCPFPFLSCPFHSEPASLSLHLSNHPLSKLHIQPESSLTLHLQSLHLLRLHPPRTQHHGHHLWHCNWDNWRGLCSPRVHPVHRATAEYARSGRRMGCGAGVIPLPKSLVPLPSVSIKLSNHCAYNGKEGWRRCFGRTRFLSMDWRGFAEIWREGDE